MAGDKPTKEEKESACSTDHTPPPSSPRRRSPSPNSRIHNNPDGVLPSPTDCQSCRRHFPPKPQTLTSLRPLQSEWRVVLLCDDCLLLVKSAAKCSYCFSGFSAGGDRFLNCRQCSCRIHLDCVPSRQRFISPSIVDPDSFLCVDCCAMPRSGSRNPVSLFTRGSVEELAREAKEKETAAVRAKQKALQKVRAATCAANQAKEALSAVATVEIDPVVKDEQLALQLHLAMNGSQRISRSCWSMNLGQSVEAKKATKISSCSRRMEKVELCAQDMHFFDSLNSSTDSGSVERKDMKGEVNGFDNCSLGEIHGKEQGSSSYKVVNSSGDDTKPTVWITYQRANKLKGVGSWENSSEKKQQILNGGSVIENFSLSPDRYAKKYSKRKLTCKNAS